MKEVVLTGLDGANPLGFFAALGVLEVLSERGVPARLQWRDESVWRPVLTGFDGGIDALVGWIDEDRVSCSAEPAIGLEYDGKQDLKPAPAVFRTYLEHLVAQAPTRTALIGSVPSSNTCTCGRSTGLNLTAASYVVLFDPWWNPAVEAQAIDRTHRIGQHRTVIAYRLLARGTIEEKIWELQRHKAALASELLGEGSFARGLTRDDLNYLLAEI